MTLTTILLTTLLDVYASMWVKNPADTTLPGYRVIQAEGKTVRMAPITEYEAPGNENHYNKLHHHGVALESSKMAYRIYFDKKQTIDIYCKRQPRMELAECYWYPQEEHLKRGFGDDVLKVSGCIGVGALKPYDEKEQKMIHYEEVDRREQRIVEQGKYQGVMEMTVYGWQNGDKKIKRLTTRYTMRSDAQGMMAEMFASEEVSNMCTGVQFLPLKTNKEKCDYIVEKVMGGWLVASYGTEWPVNDTIHYAKETTGMAVFVPGIYAKKCVTDKNNNLCLLRPGRYARYYLMAIGTTKAEYANIRNKEEFWAYAREWAKHPTK